MRSDALRSPSSLDAGAPDASILRMDNICKRYEGRRVLDGVSLTVQAGEALLVLGRNGAGKSTLLSIISGRVRADAGCVRIGGLDAARDAAVRGMIGYAGHEAMLHPALTVTDNLCWFARATGHPRPTDRAREVIALTGLHRAAATPCGVLSHGEARRAGLARALIGAPRLLLLDEPFAGLDEPGCVELQQLLRQLRTRDCALLLTSHQAELALACATRVTLLECGALMQPVAADDDPAVVALRALLAHGADR